MLLIVLCVAVLISEQSHLTPSFGVTPFEIRNEHDSDMAKNRVSGLSVSEEIITLALFVLIQYQNVTDRQTGGQTDRRTSRS